jgi:hypothetical protein
VLRPHSQSANITNTPNSSAHFVSVVQQMSHSRCSTLAPTSKLDDPLLSNKVCNAYTYGSFLLPVGRSVFSLPCTHRHKHTSTLKGSEKQQHTQWCQQSDASLTTPAQQHNYNTLPTSTGALSLVLLHACACHGKATRQAAEFRCQAATPHADCTATLQAAPTTSPHTMCSKPPPSQ